jgi:hypothetical protein
MFNINFHNVVDQNIPPKTGMPKPILKAWLYALIQPVVELYNIFYAYRTQTLYSLSITGQVIYLEKLLNDKYNSGGTEIYISDGEFNNAPFIYNTAEARPDLFLYNTAEAKPDLFLYNTSEYTSGNNDFVINVPDTITFDTNEMTSLINLYKLAGKSFTIETYTP